MPTLEEATDALDATCVAVLGDTIIYTLSGSADRTVKAHISYADGVVDLGAGQLIDQDMIVELVKTDLPLTPTNADRLVLSRWPDKIFRPANIATDESGTHWRMNVKEVI